MTPADPRPGDRARLSPSAWTADVLHARPLAPDPDDADWSQNPAVTRLRPGEPCLVLALARLRGPTGRVTVHALLLPAGQSRPGWTWLTSLLLRELP